MGYLPYQPVQDFFHQQYHGANISNMLGGHDPRLTNRRHLEKAETAPHCLAQSPHLMAPGWWIVSRNFWTRSTRFWHKVLENPHFGAWKSINMHYMFMARALELSSQIPLETHGACHGRWWPMRSLTIKRLWLTLVIRGRLLGVRR